jgi:hypothetical protein
VVRALDVDADGIAAKWLAEHIRARGAEGDRRLANDGYVIFNRRIASARRGWTWRAYIGDSPHTDHIHISCTRDAAGYAAGGDWSVRAAKVPPTTTPRPDLPVHALGSRELRLTTPQMRGTDVAFVQRWVGANDDGTYGPLTKQRVERYQGIVGLTPTGVVDQATWRAMRVG